jgi:hypothetical protein
LEAVRITSVRTRRKDGVEEITHLAASQGGLTQWLTVQQIIAAIEDGKRYFIQSGSESMLLSIEKNRRGEKTLVVGFEPGPSRLLTLPRG